MSKTLSLKYLLLDIISKKNISPNVKHEISYSLEVKISGSNYLTQCLVLVKIRKLFFLLTNFLFIQKTKDQKILTMKIKNLVKKLLIK